MPMSKKSAYGSFVLPPQADSSFPESFGDGDDFWKRRKGLALRPRVWRRVRKEAERGKGRRRLSHWQDAWGMFSKGSYLVFLLHRNRAFTGKKFRAWEKEERETGGRGV